MKHPATTAALVAACLLAVGLAAPAARAQPATRPAGPVVPAQAELDQRFARTLTNAVMAGSFSVTGKDKPPASDKYVISSAVKGEGDHWIITAQVQFAGHDIPVALSIPVKWAGDAAVITVDDVGIPGLSKYKARVLIYDDNYAGIWSSSDGSHGGQMWGKIEHAAATKPAGAK